MIGKFEKESYFFLNINKLNINELSIYLLFFHTLGVYLFKKYNENDTTKPK